MSDVIKHECGIVLLRLKKPLGYYAQKYGTPLYGLQKLYLLMEKQRNRGQDGAGIANIKLHSQPGQRYISLLRSVEQNPVQDLFDRVNQTFSGLDISSGTDISHLQSNFPFSGELFLGHLRYGTYGSQSLESCHPFLRQNNWKTRNLILSGNFTLTNVDELFGRLIDLGQHPKEVSDTVTIMENIGHFLDQENEKLFKRFKAEGYSNTEISNQIAKHLDITSILSKSAEKWDGGYVMTGLLGHGEGFVLRDPNGIRPAFTYENDDVAVATSERPPIQTIFDAPLKEIHELKPGHIWTIHKGGQTSLKAFKQAQEKTSCSFERIYFSRGNDKDIYTERKHLGKNLLPDILKAIDFDLSHTVFSFIPNTAETSFLGLMEALHEFMHANQDHPKAHTWPTFPRMEKIAIKDAKFRTFIAQDVDRDEWVAHVYDVTYGLVRPEVDQLVLIDDSIVRGTTLKKSILHILSRLNPKKIIIASSAPQVRYPDCYGIDMAKIRDFVAFQAAMALLKETQQNNIVESVYQACQATLKKPIDEIHNEVKSIYAPFTDHQISHKIANLITPSHTRCPVEIVYQSIEGLHDSIPNHRGDWYFSGNYPTPGGARIVNQSFVRFIEGNFDRAYA